MSAFVAENQLVLGELVTEEKSNEITAVPDFEYFQKELPCFVTRMKDHGRIEKREYRLLTDLSWLPRREEWAGLQAVCMATATKTA